MAGVVPLDDLPANLVPAGDLPDELSPAMTKTAEPQQPSAFGNAISTITENPYVQSAGTMVKKAALPMAGGQAGLMAGTAIGGPVGGVIGESLGSGIGEAANQLVGINEPSLAEIGLAMAAGPVMRGLAAGVKTGTSALLKAAGGRQAIADIAEGVAKKLFSPVTSSEDLFAQVASKGAINVPAVSTASAITSTLAAEAKRAPTAVRESIEAALMPLQKFYQPMPGVASTHTAADLAVEAKRLRGMASAAFKNNNPDLGHALSTVRKAIFDDAAASGVPEIREAVKAYRREAAVEELQGILRQANPLKSFKDLQDKNALFRDVFTRSEQDQIKNLLNKMATVTPSGFSGVAGRAISTVMGQQAAGVTGAIAGFVAPEIAAGVIATKPGRVLMEKLLVGNTWDAPRAAALAQFWRAQRAEDAKSGDIAEQVKNALKDPATSIEDKIAQAQMRSAIIAAGTGGVESAVQGARY